MVNSQDFLQHVNYTPMQGDHQAPRLAVTDLGWNQGRIFIFLKGGVEKFLVAWGASSTERALAGARC
jgi:hypothetical protein